MTALLRTHTRARGRHTERIFILFASKPTLRAKKVRASFLLDQPVGSETAEALKGSMPRESLMPPIKSLHTHAHVYTRSDSLLSPTRHSAMSLTLYARNKSHCGERIGGRKIRTEA